MKSKAAIQIGNRRAGAREGSLNYRHAYHAGNFADVVKHTVLMLLIEHLLRKPKPFVVLDTHAGAGAYDLEGVEAGRTGEFRDGIGRLGAAAGGATLPPVVTRYLELVAAHSADAGDPDERRYYPGSPAVIRRLLRPQDRLIACELHPPTAAALRGRFAGDPQVAVHQRDGYEALRALLPPAERRGMVLIDPPYETADEMDTLLRAVDTALARWPEGIYALWYPIKDRVPVWRLQDRIAALPLRRLIAAELTLFDHEDALRLNGCGLMIINPPWQFEDRLAELLPPLHALLNRAGGHAKVVPLAEK